jgi:Holliday junction resolvase
MASKSKAKGTRFENEIVKVFIENGFQAVRAWGSNGKSLGFEEDVDIVVKKLGDLEDFKIQAKRRAALPKYLEMGNCDAVVIREDREVPKVIIPLMDLIGILTK